MEYSIQNLSKSKIEIDINVSKETWAQDVKKSYEKNKYKYSVEGFRKGKVPMSIIVGRYGMDVLFEDALEESLSKYYADIITKDKLNVVGSPSLSVNEVSEDGVKAVITVCIYPEFELGQYKGLDIKKESAEVSEEEVMAVVNKELQDRSRLVEKDENGVVENGDVVTLDYSGSVDGEKFDGGTAENQTLEIGSQTFIPGFEEQMMGMKKGETKDLNVTFPEQYTPDLAGKNAVFTVTVHEIKAKEAPALDDEFVKDIDDTLNTVDEWKESIKAKLTADKEKAVKDKVENDLIDAICAKTEIEIPECMIEEELDANIEELDESMGAYGLSLAEYVKYSGTTIDDIRKERRDSACKNLKSRLVIEAIIKAENLLPGEEELKAEFDKMTDEEKKNANANQIVNRMTIDKLFDFLLANNNIN